MESVIEYEGELLSDGSLPLPQSVRQQLAATPRAPVRITIQMLASVPALEQQEEAWNAFGEIGKESTPGRLPNASARHDEHLYGTKR